MQVEMKKTTSLLEYDNNPRHNEEAIEAVANSIREFGFKVPIVISSDNVIIAGHTRLKASVSLGLEEVPCIIADDLNEKQIKAFRLADNKTAELATWDLSKLEEELSHIDMDMLQFGFEEMEELLPDNASDDDFDITDEIPEEPFSQPGDIYELGAHRLMCGDSTNSEQWKTIASIFFYMNHFIICLNIQNQVALSMFVMQILKDLTLEMHSRMLVINLLNVLYG